jgi:hypothetical protein
VLAGLTAIEIEARAESNFVTQLTGTLMATARLDFRVTIPRVLFLRVGTGTDFVANGTVDLISFAIPAATVGNGASVTATGGDLGDGAVTVRVQGNGGDITLNSNTTGRLTTGTAGETVGWNRITVTSAALSSTTVNFTNGSITHPAFNLNGGAGTAVTLTSINSLVRREGMWTYSYANQDVLAAGTYGGAGVNNGRVSYTATMP